jgi:hypothetical protein
MNGPIGTLAFISIFHVLGGGALGLTLRSLRKGINFTKIFLLVWGTMFGCMPLAIGVQNFAQANMTYLFVAEILVLIGAIGVTAFIPDWILDTFKSPEVMTIGAGGLFFFIGVAVGGATIKTDPIFALLFGGVFAGAGALLLYRGLRTML